MKKIASKSRTYRSSSRKNEFNRTSPTTKMKLDTSKLSSRQTNKLAKMAMRNDKIALKNQRVMAQTKADTIRAVGSAFAQNLAPTVSSAIIANSTAKNYNTSAVQNANSLINAGTGKTQEKNNSTDEQNSSEGANYRE